MTDGKRYCLRGHDTSDDASRTYRRCKRCKALCRNVDYDHAYEQSYNRQASRYKQYKKKLRQRIELKKERLLEYEKEVSNRDGATESY